MATFILKNNSGSITAGQLEFNPESKSLALGDGSKVINIAKLNDVNSGSFNISGDLFVSGNANIVGNLTFGDNSGADTVTVVASLSSSLIPEGNNVHDLGSTAKYWKTGYITAITGSLSGSVNGIDITPFSASVDSRLDVVEATASLYIPFSTSVDIRLDDLEWTGSNHEGRLDLLESAMSGSLRLYVSPSGSDLNDGKEPHTPFKTIKAAVASLGAINPVIAKRYTIVVGSGNYTEQNPIVVPPGVSIVGDTLRNVRLTAANPTKDFFHCHDSNYFWGLRFLDLKHPAFAFSFPCSTATATISGGSVSTINLIDSLTGYTDGTNLDLGIVIEGPDASGSIATATADVVGGVITQINVVSGGNNYTITEKPHISIPAPTGQRPIISTSPYVQNCSSITGPFRISNGIKIPVTTPLPYDTSDVDEQGAGGGIRIDGNLVAASSPLESFVADAFTQVNQGGPGHLVINKGYAQFVSCFTTFCTYGFKVVNGGFANISNSVIDFGKKGLISKTYYPTAYNTAVANESKYSSVTGFEITQDGAGYTGSVANVTLSAPDIMGGTQATAEAVVSILGTITSVYITNSGSGYTSEPSVTIAPPTEMGGVQATADAIISGVTQMRMVLSNTTQSIEISSNMILDGQNYLVTNVENGSTSSEKLITTFPNPPQIVNGNNVYFHKLSNISTGGLVCEYVGSGVTFNALPKFGGVPDRTKEVIQIAPGRIFYSTVDNIGNLKIGEYFAVDQLTGEVTIDARNFNLSGINQIGPFRRNGISVGKILKEVSDSVTLVNSQGVVGSDTVPTQYAVFGYVNNFTSSANDRIDLLEATASNHETRIDNLELISSSYLAFTQSYYNDSASVSDSLNEIHAYTSSLKAAIEVSGSGVGSLTTIYGDLKVEGTQSIIHSENLAVKDNLIYLNDSSSITNPDLGIVGNYNDGTYAHTGIYRESVGGKWRVFKGLTDEPSGSINSGHPSFQLADFEANEVSASINGIGRVGAYSASVDSRLVKLESISSSYVAFTQSYYTDSASFNTRISASNVEHTEFSASAASVLNSLSGAIYLTDSTQSNNISTISASAWGAFQSASSYSSSLNNTINSVSQSASESLSLVSQSVSTSLSIVSHSLNTFSSSYKNDSSSFDSRIDNLELISSSYLSFTQSYYNDSSSFDTRISASTLTFNDTTGQTGIDFTKIGTQVSAIASGLSTTSNVQFNNITASNSISASGTVYCDTLVASTLVGATLPVLEYETNGTLGNLLIKGATSKSIQVVDTITFTGMTQNGIDQYSATGLYMTGSITASLGFSGSVSGIGNVTLFSSSIDQRIKDATNEQYIAGFATTASLQIVSASAWGAFQSASSYSGSFYTTINNLSSSVYTFSSSIDSRVDTLEGTTHTHSNKANLDTINQNLGTTSTGVQFASLGVGTAPDATYEFKVAGDIAASGDIVAFNSSDERLKENIKQIENGLEKINKISGYEFDWNEDLQKARKGHDVGILAHEIEEILPEAVTRRDNGYLAVDYEKIIPLLIQSVKELSAKVTELENK